MDPCADEIEFEWLPFIRVYKNGRVERFDGTEIAPASSTPVPGVISKDVTINPSLSLTARLYLPEVSDSDTSDGNKKLPVLIYFHGGAFIIHTAASPGYHSFVSRLSAAIPAVVVSVSYRLVPEARIPAAYDDAVEAIRWAVSKSDPWIESHGDTSRIFVAGDSAGGNIAHNAACLVGSVIKGMVLLNPYFWGKDPIGSEPADSSSRYEFVKNWAFFCAGKCDIDHPWVNPMEAGDARDIKCERVLVTVAENDLFHGRGVKYVEWLRANGVVKKAELHTAAGKSHVYFLSAPDCEEAVEEMQVIVSFINEK